MRHRSDAGRVVHPVPTTWLLLMLMLSAERLPSQASAVVDAATFMIAKKGAPVGRESFQIVRAPGPGGQVYRVTSTSAVGETKLEATLTTDSTGAPVSYVAQVSQRGATIQRVDGSGRPDRFSVMVRSRGGESAREYVVRRGTILLEDDVVNQYYFVLRAAVDSQITMISPRTAQQDRLRVEDMGLESVTIASKPLPARRWGLVDARGLRRELWVDAQGRLLKISVPDRAMTAVRDDPPR